MSMKRYMCQLCWSVVHYGERHTCFFYKDEGLSYTVPPPKESEEVERRHEETQETHSGSWNKNSLNICKAAQTDLGEEYEERISSPIEDAERIFMVSAWETKTRYDSILQGNKSSRDSEGAANASTGRGEPEDAKKSQVERSRKNASAEATRRVDSSCIGEATCSSALSSVADGEAENGAAPSRIQTQSPGSENERAFVCSVCGRCFSAHCYLDIHRKSQVCEKRFACPMCDKEFSHKRGLEYHSWTHTGEKPFPCDICDKRFTQPGNLVIHRRTHTGEKPFKCERCSRDFADPSAYSRHLKKCTAKNDAHLGDNK